ncbi:MAG: hypothetical protein IID41_15180, partial [Planctomycetes bacterium]|nr:hypothetical protein [Planctomycetota bacterium]
FAPGHALRRAITTAATKMDLSRHAYASVVVMPAATLTGLPVGVSVSAIAANGFGWLQTRGAVGVLGEGSLLAGTRASVPGPAVAGAVGVETPDVNENDVESTIGNILVVAANGAFSTVYLTIDG